MVDAVTLEAAKEMAREKGWMDHRGSVVHPDDLYAISMKDYPPARHVREIRTHWKFIKDGKLTHG